MKEQSEVKIKIAFVSPNAWTMYNFRKDVLQSMLHSGHEVIIIAEEDNYTPALLSIGCTFVPIAVNNRSLKPTDDIRLFFQLKNIYTKYRPDFIFHYVIKPNIYGTLAAGLLRIPSIAVITGLGHAFNKNSFLSALIKKMYKFSLRYAHQVWCLNTDDVQFFIGNHIVPKAKIIILPGEGVNTEHFKKIRNHNQPPGIFTFLMSARLLKSKGIIEYAEATYILKKKGLHFQSVLMGAVEDHPDAISQHEIDRAQQVSGLKYIGFTDDVRSYLETADCFVYPSYYNEGVPRSLMEACSMELPVITTDNTGCRELIRDGINGYLCEKHDPIGLACKMEKMISLDNDNRILMGKKARVIVEEKFAVAKVVSFYTQILDVFAAVKVSDQVL